MPLLTVGDPAPAFSVPSIVNPTAALDEMGGCYSLLFFFGSSQIEQVRETLETVFALQTQFEQYNLRFFGISIDSNDIYLKEQIEKTTHCAMLWDFQRTVSSQYGVSESLAAEGIIDRYDERDRGFFKSHRDNTLPYGEAEAKIRAQEQQQVLFSGASMGQVSKQARSLPGNTALGFKGDRAKKKKR